MLQQSAVLVGSLALVLFRVHLSALLIASGSVSGVLLGVLGVVVCATTVWAWSRGRPDLTWSGLGVGLLYLVALAFDADGQRVALVAPIFWVLLAAKCWVRWCVRRSCTVTGPVFVNVVERGPYAWLRHPMCAIDSLAAVAFVCEFPSVWNLAVLGLVLLANIAITLFEERFLMREAAYRRYALRVRWRLLPGVW